MMVPVEISLAWAPMLLIVVALLVVIAGEIGKGTR